MFCPPIIFGVAVAPVITDGNCPKASCIRSGIGGVSIGLSISGSLSASSSPTLNSCALILDIVPKESYKGFLKLGSTSLISSVICWKPFLTFLETLTGVKIPFETLP